MLKLNLKRAIADKGIDSPARFLQKCGIASYSASRLLNDDASSINFGHLEKICVNLKCTVDDLFVWQPDKKDVVDDNHPLLKLKKNQKKGDLNEKLKNLPFNKVERLKSYIDKLNAE